MIGYDPVAGGAGAFRDRVGGVLRCPDQRAEQIDVVIVVHALHHGGNALQTHAGIDRGTRQVDALVLRQLLELHEDEVPDLDEPVAVLIGMPGGPPGI